MPVFPVNNYSTTVIPYEHPVYNQVDYSGYKLTKQGNLYKESNSWKTYAPMIAAPWGAINAMSANAEFSHFPKQKQPMSLKLFTVAYAAFISGLLWLGMGTIIDKIIDSSRAKRADELAAQDSWYY